MTPRRPDDPGAREGSSGANAAAKRYADSLETLIRERAREDVIDDFDDLCRNAHGAFPADLAYRARRLGIRIEPRESPYSGEDYKPDPSPVHSEYFFTRESATRIASVVSGKTLCLGTPTVAVALAAAGKRSTLVDASPWAVERFDLSSKLITRLVGLQVENLRVDHAFDSAVLDPPWYMPALSYWLKTASGLVREGGEILVPLMGKLTRPSAISDRHEFRILAASLGTASVSTTTIEYESPLFERLAVSRAGASISRPWRQARILRVINGRPGGIAQPPENLETWTDYRIGDSIVSILLPPEESASPSLEFEIRPVSQTSFELDTTSRRDKRIMSANVWTSQSTAAWCSNPFGFAAALVQRGTGPRSRQRDAVDATLKKLGIPE